MTTNELTCKELVELVTEYVEGSLAPQEKRQFEEHLDLCPGCRTYVAQMRQTIELLGRLTEEDIHPRARQDLLRLFRQWKDGGKG